MTVIVPLGGFLGAGKTNLILAAAQVLNQTGLKAAAILNDHGAELVDTRWVQSEGVPADQVSGGCFCCLFSDLMDAAERLRDKSPDVIFAEAVGSCTDISATTLQPLKLYHANKFRVAPYTVLVDPARAQDLAQKEADPNFLFLFNKQLEEADLVCFTKSDLYSDFPKIAVDDVRYLSSRTHSGVQAWLNEVLGDTLSVGSKILDVDYEHYARAEAGLAWLNCSASLFLETALSPSLVLGPLLDSFEQSLTQQGFRIAHLKIADSASTGFLKASITANGQEPSVFGQLDASPAD
ncbi:MAG TPA: GTP-binding protein, partial [Blastocatellia bacterium]|nr:GTP-binding protein [Blastocatellia bacterium]